VSLFTLVFSLYQLTTDAHLQSVLWILLGPIPLYVYVSDLLERRALATQPHIDQAWDSGHATLQEGFANVRLVKAARQERKETSQYRENWLPYHDRRIEKEFWHLYSLTSRVVVEYGCQAVILYSALTSQHAETLTSGKMVQLITLQQFVYGPLGNVLKLVRTIQAASIASQSLLDIVDEAQNSTELDNAALLPSLAVEIRLAKVSFSYRPSASSPAKGPSPPDMFLDCSIQARKTTAIVGRSGSGTVLFLDVGCIY